jgi:hypothetical protein
MTATYAPWGTSAWAVCVHQESLSAAPRGHAPRLPATLRQVGGRWQRFSLALPCLQ